jgi:hypothetical protein
MRNFAGGLPWPLGEVTLVHNMETSRAGRALLGSGEAVA